MILIERGNIILEIRRRLLFLDIMRGIAILVVIVDHAIVYGLMKTEQNAIEYLPQSPLIIFMPTLLLGTWAGIFSIINGIANVYSVQWKLTEGTSLKTALRGPLVNSSLLIFLHLLFQLLFTRNQENMFGTDPWYSMIGGSLIRGEFTPPNGYRIFISDALSSIGMSGFLSCLLILILWRKNSQIKSIQNIRILLGIAIVWLIISPFLWKFLYYTFLIPSIQKGGLFYILAFILSLISTHSHGLLPYGSYTICGMIYGIYLYEGASIERIQKYARVFGLSLIFCGIFLIIFHILTVPNITVQFFFSYIVIPPDLYLINLGIMIIWIEWFIRKFEYADEIKYQKYKNSTIFIRKLSAVTLTLFCLEPIWCHLLANMFRNWFSFIIVENDVLMEKFWAQLIYLTIYLGVWYGLLYFWDKYLHFKYNFEYWFVVVGNLFRKDKSQKLKEFKKEKNS